MHCILWQQNSFALNCSSWQCERVHCWAAPESEPAQEGAGRRQQSELWKQKGFACACDNPAWSFTGHLRSWASEHLVQPLLSLSRSCLFSQPLSRPMWFQFPVFENCWSKQKCFCHLESKLGVQWINVRCFNTWSVVRCCWELGLFVLFKQQEEKWWSESDLNI